MQNFRLIALDPGGTTGWATFTALKMPVVGGSSDEFEYHSVEWKCGQVGPYEHHQELYAMLCSFQVQETHVICESFEYRNKTRPGLELITREYIGVAKLFCAERNVQLHMQSASMGKGFVRDTNIKRLGLWSVGWKHAMDSYRHLLYYMINAGHIIEHELLTSGWK